MKIGLFALLFLVPFLASTQNPGSIRGEIQDDNHRPVEFATIFVSAKNDSLKVISGTISDSTGRFLLANLPYGAYVLNVQLVGYTKHQQAFLLNESNSNQNLSPIVLQTDAQLLDAVEVRGLRNMIKKRRKGL